VNGVIAAAIFSARRLHWTVYGFHDGFLHLATGDPAVVRANIIPLDQEDASQFYRTGGSIVRSDRYDPTRSPQKIAGILSALAHFKVRYLLVLGGNDKIATTHVVTRGVDPAAMQVIFVPKTVDNDIQLPTGECSLGFRSAVDRRGGVAALLHRRDAWKGGGPFGIPDGGGRRRAARADPRGLR
jgi:6-phosphofructokinase 1